MVDQSGDIDIQDTKGGWICPTTRAFIDEAHLTPGYSLLNFLHGYVYSRWPYMYIGVGTGEPLEIQNLLAHAEDGIGRSLSI